MVSYFQGSSILPSSWGWWIPKVHGPQGQASSIAGLKAGQMWPLLLSQGGIAKICLHSVPTTRGHSSGSSRDPRGRHSAGEKLGWTYPFAVWY